MVFKYLLDSKSVVCNIHEEFSNFDKRVVYRLVNYKVQVHLKNIECPDTQDRHFDNAKGG
jgi:hypothetical protein